MLCQITSKCEAKKILQELLTSFLSGFKNVIYVEVLRLHMQKMDFKSDVIGFTGVFVRCSAKNKETALVFVFLVLA